MMNKARFNGGYVKIRIFLGMLLAGLSMMLWANEPLKVGTNVWPGYEPFYLAQKQQNWGENGKIDIVGYASATEVLRAFRNQQIQAAAVTLDEALLLQESKLPFKIVLVTDISHGADVILARPEIERFSDLKGKRVGVEGTALGGYLLSRALALHQMSLNDIEIVQLDVSAHEQAYQNHQVDAVVTFEPAKTKIINAGAHEIFSSVEMPGEIVDVLLVHQNFLNQSPQLVRELIDGWFMALNSIQYQPVTSMEIISKRLRISPQEAQESFRGLSLPTKEENLRMLSPPSELNTDNVQDQSLLPSLQRLQDNMLAQDLLRLAQPQNLKGLITSEYLLPPKTYGK